MKQLAELVVELDSDWRDGAHAPCILASRQQQKGLRGIKVEVTGRGRPRALTAVAAAGVVGLVVSVAGCGGGTNPSWDSRILPLAQFVQKDRGLRFSHPVAVNFLSTKAFEAKVAEGDVLSPADRAKAADEVAALRALGLADGSPDLGNLQSQADQSGTVGFYDSQTKKLYVEGTQLTPYVRVTIAHELTHALQDQRLGLSNLDNRPDDQQPAIAALVEGDATVVENDYESSFTPREQQSYDAENNAAGSSGSPDLPEFIADENSFPYDFGRTFVDALVANGGNERVDAAFRNPPVATAEILDPSLYLKGWSPLPVPSPRIPTGARELEPPSQFGQLELAETLGSRLGYDGWNAVQGWMGDSSVLYKQGGRACVAIDTLFDTPADASTFDAAAAKWSTGLAGPSAGFPGPSVTQSADEVDLRACDPGPDASIPQSSDTGTTLYDGLVARADLLDNLITGDVPSVPQAECVADHTIRIVGVSSAIAYDQSSDGAPTDAQISEAETTARKACSGPSTSV